MRQTTWREVENLIDIQTPKYNISHLNDSFVNFQSSTPKKRRMNHVFNLRRSTWLSLAMLENWVTFSDGALAIQLPRLGYYDPIRTDEDLQNTPR
jgi:hypothetical protein